MGHPDDECYLSAGLMATVAKEGRRVVCVTATCGEAGVTDAARWPAADLARIREAELAESLRILGVHEHRWLDLPDGGCDALDPAPIVDALAAMVRELSPAIVVSFGPEGISGHPDHKAVGAWAASAFERAAPLGAQLWHPIYSTRWERQWGDAPRPPFQRRPRPARATVSSANFAYIDGYLAYGEVLNPLPSALRRLGQPVGLRRLPSQSAARRAGHETLAASWRGRRLSPLSRVEPYNRPRRGRHKSGAAASDSRPAQRAFDPATRRVHAKSRSAQTYVVRDLAAVTSMAR